MVNKNCSSYINDIRCSGLNTIHFITVPLTKALFISLLSLILDIGEQFFRLSFANSGYSEEQVLIPAPARRERKSTKVWQTKMIIHFTSGKFVSSSLQRLVNTLVG